MKFFKVEFVSAHGLKSQLSELAIEHDVLQNRTAAIEARTLSQQQRMIQIYSGAMMLKTKVRTSIIIYVCLAVISSIGLRKGNYNPLNLIFLLIFSLQFMRVKSHYSVVINVY